MFCCVDFATYFLADCERIVQTEAPHLQLSWSTIGRPWTGWLHWGNDNDGGYFSPAGGQTWDPEVSLCSDVRVLVVTCLWHWIACVFGTREEGQ